MTHRIKKEFVIILALLISLTALSIDTMLPALPMIASDLGVVVDNDRQLVLTVLFLGLAIGQLVYGPISDSFGRKIPVLIGLGLFIGGSVMSALSTSFEVLLASRFIQGFGIAGPRTLAMAIVRDQYKGNTMASIASLIMMVFILVPMLAPMIGQGILMISTWRMIFWFFVGLGLITTIWFWIRQTETLPRERRHPLSVKAMLRAAREVMTNRISAGHTVCMSLVFGAFVGFLSSCQQILQEQYQTGDLFVFYFGALACGVGFASFINSRLVMRFSMVVLCRTAISSQVVLSFILLGLTILGGPKLWQLMLLLMAIFFFIGLLFGNLNAMAMTPMGHIAGMASAIIGSISSLISLFFGYQIGRAYDGTLYPLVGGFIVLGIAALLVLKWANRGVDPAVYSDTGH